MASNTIDLFPTARTTYLPTDRIAIGCGNSPVPTYQGTVNDLFNYMQKGFGTGQLSAIGSSNYVMSSTDTELITTTALTSPPTWQLPKANFAVAGQRRRFVDLAGVCSLTSFQIAIAPAAGDKING